MVTRLFLVPFLGVFMTAAPAVAATEDFTFRAQVTHVLSEERVELPGTTASFVVQQLRARTDAGEEIFFENDRVPLRVGDYFFGTYIESDGVRVYSVRDPDRRGVLALAVGLFVAAVAFVGRATGVRSLVSLAVSIAAIVFVLLPLLASGAPPLIVSLAASLGILGLAMAITHGVTRTTRAAFVASALTVGCALVLGELFVSAARLAGFASDESAVLNLATGGTLNMEGILLGAIIIGVLGIIDDLTITQVATVAALRSANPLLLPRELYQKALAVGREHLGAVINTLVLAYAGGALPLLLLFSLSPSSPLSLINSDVMAVEVVRAAVGGIALALALPLSTWLGVIASRFDSGKSQGDEPVSLHRH